MEAEKRKQADQSDVVSGSQKQKKPRDDDGAVKEGEVEEFFAILKRIHVAVRQFKAEGGGRKLGDGGGSRLRAMFESNVEVKLGPGRGEGVDEEMGLDLNADPDPDPETDPSEMGF